ncbi:MAG: AI-2E family transporter [Melioribacteraceae bacterium]|nr:AI-2E family transporter [Melioribacteraceae bacterium]MCF8266020.1 AI-2E family transporter [Melioribacteraceae bacterium]MCF8412250.1 AI-2E family transporter [Melioribacteraceae bacterium]MCF8432581.1 AI-2E family transporter [Melioribacteraceae bacterium]
MSPIRDQLLRRSVKGMILLTILGMVLLISYLFFDIIIMLIASILLTMIFNPLITFLERKGIERIISVLVVFVLVGVTIVLASSLLIPKIITQMNSITSNITQEEITKTIETIESDVKRFIPFVETTNLAEEVSRYFSSLVATSIDNLTNIVSGIFSIVAILVIVPFISFFLLKDNEKIVKGIINLMPNKYFEVTYWIIYKIGQQLSRFVRGWILDAFLVGLMVGLGLTFWGIENSISIGLVAGIGHLIPYFGPLIGGLPAIIISIIQFGDFSMAVEIVLMFLVIYTLDNGYIQPNVFSKSTDMHPLMIIILILVGSNILGVLGMLIAVPVATVIKTAAREIYFGYKNYKIIKL